MFRSLYTSILFIEFFSQKFRCNAEPATVQEEVNNDTSESIFDKLLEGETNNEENDRGETIAAAVAAAVAPKSAKKKSVRLNIRFENLLSIIYTTRNLISLSKNILLVFHILIVTQLLLRLHIILRFYIQHKCAARLRLQRYIETFESFSFPFY